VVEEVGRLMRRIFLLSNSSALALLLACLFAAAAPRASAEEKWADTRSVGPFVCQATFPLAECDPILVELPELQRELTRTLGIPPARQPIDIHLFANEAEHQAYIERHFPHVPYRRALFVQEGDYAGVYAYCHPELAIDIRHECTHALLHGVLHDLPLWLDEGLAEYFEVPPSQRAFDHPHFDALRWNMRLGMIMTVESLEQRAELAEMSAFDYRYSWAWVHFLLHGPEGAHRTLVNLANLQNGSSPGRLSARLSTAVPNSPEKMVQHFRHWR
jgi:hypothetical protein